MTIHEIVKLLTHTNLSTAWSQKPIDETMKSEEKDGKRVVLNCTLPSTGYHFGQSIPITCSVENGTESEITLRGW